MKTDKRAITLFLAIGLCLIPSSTLAGVPAAAALAAPAPPGMAAPALLQRPAPVHKFFDGPKILLLGISAAMMAADIATTRQALQVPRSREANPLAQSSGALYALKFAGFGAGLGISYMMHRTGHYKAERIVPLIVGVPSANAAAHNVRIRQ